MTKSKICKHQWVTPPKKNFNPPPVTSCSKCGKNKKLK